MHAKAGDSGLVSCRVLWPLLFPASVLAVALGLSACAGTGTVPNRTSEGAFDPVQFGKTDIDRVIDVHQREIFVSLRLLAEKLYKRNPREWRKAGQPSAEAAVARIFEQNHRWQLAELDNKRDLDALRLAFKPEFQGDRVAACMIGLASMVQTAFANRTESYAFDSIDAQTLYNAARNVEIAVWKLENSYDVAGQPLLLTNESGGTGGPRNLSFEREFGKIVGQLDVLSKVMADKNQRAVTRVVQSMATAVFLPIK